MQNHKIRITATVPYDCEFSTDPDVAHNQRAEFMRRASDRIVETAIPDVDHIRDADEILARFDFDNADINTRGWTVSVLDRDCAERLLSAGLLDQTRVDIITRWGSDADEDGVTDITPIVRRRL